MEREQHKGNFKKPDICGKPCRLQADCRQHEKQETPLESAQEWEVIPDTHEGIVTQEEFDTVSRPI